jgi:hypothetical protein
MKHAWKSMQVFSSFGGSIDVWKDNIKIFLEKYDERERVDWIYLADDRQQ